jgi:ribosome-associated protein
LKKNPQGKTPLVNSHAKAIFAAKLAQGKKADNICILDMRQTCNFCDYFVLCTCSSLRHIQSIREELEAQFKKLGITRISSNNEEPSEWQLLDYGDLVFHIFSDQARAFYDLEHLWADALPLTWDFPPLKP